MVPYRGYTLIHHGGNIDGFSTMVAFVPQEKIGVVVLTNIDSRPLRDVLTYEVVDRMLGLPDNRWNPRWHALHAEMMASIDRDRQVTAQARLIESAPTHPLEAYTGEYAAEGYADFKVRQDGDQLMAWIAGDWYPLQHYHYDIFNLDLDRFELRLPVRFLMNVQGEIDEVSLPIEPEVQPVTFKRKPLVLDVETLSRLAGRYALPIEGMELTVALKKDRLFMAVTGQAERELLPRRASPSALEFQVKGATEIFLEFQQDAEGAYRFVLLKQVGQVYQATRAPEA